MQFQVENRHTVTQIKPKVPHVIISIADEPGRRAKVATNDHTLDVLNVYFHDADQPREGMTLFNAEAARKILNFFEHYRNQAQLVVAHCDAGQCRSPAVLAALQKIVTGDDNIWFAQKRPNRLVYRTLLEEAFERGML